MKKYFLLPIVLLMFLGSCETEEQTPNKPLIKEKISGFVQKGPFVSGTSILMNELKSDLAQTGKVFTSQISNDLGLFEITNIELSSSFVEFTTSGFYFNEVSGDISISPITLTSISDIENKNTINVNVLTHLEKKRVETLIKEGKTFSESKTQSRNEILSIFLMNLGGNTDFEEFDISKNNEEGGILLAISIILQGNRSVGQLTEVLSKIQNDIASDGKLDDENILNTLRASTLNLNFKDIRNKIESRYKELNNNSPVPDFEKQLAKFLSYKDYPLTITIEGEGEVVERIIPNPSGKEYPYNTVVELTPVPKEGWVFESWGGDLTGTETPKTIKVDKEKSVTVRFIKKSIFRLGENGITCICENVKVGDKGFINGVEYEVVDNDLLKRRRDEGVDMTKLCTSLVTNMGFMFQSSSFNQPIGNWDVSNVTMMGSMFINSSFNQPIGNWDVSNVTIMGYMFLNSKFNHPIGDWDVSKVINMDKMFLNSQFNQPIGNWNVSNVTDMSGMFGGTTFNQSIENWDVSKVTNMMNMFLSSKFNHPIGDWDVSKVINMNQMFRNSQFIQPIGNWNVSNVTDMDGMFYETAFNQPIGDWDVSKVRLMNSMFYGTPFNQSIEDWDVSSVTDMREMFLSSKFNQPIGNWNVSNVTDMVAMFAGTLFNQSIGNWDVSKVTYMRVMFANSQFNQPIGNWAVSKVTDMRGMFESATSFNQNLSKWCIINITSEPDNFSSASPLTSQNKPKWGTCPD